MIWYSYVKPEKYFYIYENIEIKSSELFIERNI